jgi:hypothetical protein
MNRYETPKSAGKTVPFSAGSIKNAPHSVSYFTLGRRKICKPQFAKMGNENASHRSHRMDRRRRPGRAWPALVDCRDVQIGPPAQRGNQFARDAVRQSGSHQRQEAIHRLAQGKAQADVARSYAVSQATISRLQA